jgi:protein TonB
VSVAGAGLPDFWTAPGRRARAPWVGPAVALALHASIAAAVLTIDPARFRAETPIEMDVEEKPLPPPEVKPAPEPPPPPPERPRVAVRRAPAIPLPQAPPPTEAPPKAAEAPPVFGVSLDSTVAGDGPGMAVPVGNTLMAKPGKPAPHAGNGTATDATESHPFTPVAEMYVAKMPELLQEIKADFPTEAKQMGLEGVVSLRVGVDEKGNVVEVRVVDRAGHGFDEAAIKAMRKFKFTPAVANDGRPVPVRLLYKYRFELNQ